MFILLPLLIQPNTYPVPRVDAKSKIKGDNNCYCLHFSAAFHLNLYVHFSCFIFVFFQFYETGVFLIYELNVFGLIKNCLIFKDYFLQLAYKNAEFIN